MQAVTAGFEEPYAASVFLGNVVDFSIPGEKKSKGIGYSGLLYSLGTYHIKNNTMIRDDWWEVEWKVKGDRKTQDQKLSWSFRFGAKLHGNPEITDIYYLSFRRSRLDYRPKRDSIFNNSGFEYTVDFERGTYTPIRHYFFVEKKWPLEGKEMAFTLATGFEWESADKYSGELARIPPRAFGGTLARKGQHVLMATVPATHPCKAVVQVAAVQVTIDHLADVWPVKPMPALKTLFIDLLKGFKMILHALVVRGVLRLSRPINRLWHKRLPVVTAPTGRMEFRVVHGEIHFRLEVVGPVVAPTELGLELLDRQELKGRDA